MAKKATVAKQFEDFVGRYLAMGEDEKHIVSAWVLHSWQFSEQVPTPTTTPYLYIHSAQKGSGKSLLGIDILGAVARNAMPAADMTEATLFHLADMQTTLLIDEVDAQQKSERMRGLLNVGYRMGAKVPRMEKGEVRMYNAHCPKALIGIDNRKLPDTVRDRCIPVHMHRATEEELQTLQEFFMYEVTDELAQIAEALFDWTVSQGTKVRDYAPERIPNLTPRQWEVCRPLLQVAHVAGYETEVRKALVNVFSNVAEEVSPEIEMLSIIRMAFEEANTDRLTTVDILSALSDDDRFADWNGKQLGAKLSPFGVKGGAVRFGNQVAKGYRREAFLDAWKRYL